jgi:hypothetical protein
LEDISQKLLYTQTNKIEVNSLLEINQYPILKILYYLGKYMQHLLRTHFGDLMKRVGKFMYEKRFSNEKWYKLGNLVL